MGRFRKPVCLYGYRGFESHPLRQFLSEESVHHFCNLVCQIWRNRISNLNILLRPVTDEVVVIGKCLNSCCLPDCQASALIGIIVNEVVSILGNMARDCGAIFSSGLNPESV